MAINFQRARQLLQQFNFRQLFAEELNWATPSAKAIHVDADGETYQATPIAEQGGMMVFEIGSRKDGLIPGRSIQLKLHRRIAQTYAEHILVFVNAARSSSLWVWVKRQDGRLQARDHWYHGSQPGDSLLQKLNGIAFTYDQLDEDGRIAIGPVLDAVEASFRAERVTKRFYEQFEKEHAVFLKFINGIPDEALQKWYASVMLNRLMFIYFIQRKLFLSGDRDFLRHKLEGGDYPQGFYRDFLCPLFFKGFAMKEAERSASDRKLLGPVPYLNGGIFQQHEIERLHGKAIEISDKAFSRLFEFFDRWHWQLDERPLRQDDEINPDVLGYIFEKYINRKQMGAYYTKEDITGYISRNTILPFLLDATREKCKAAFESGTGVSPVWDLLRDDPDRYIYEAVRKGVELPLPPEIEAGIAAVSKRGGWNKPASEPYALPTEIWREVVARRQRYREIRQRLTGGRAVSPPGRGTGETPVLLCQSGTGVPPVSSEPFHAFNPRDELAITRRNLPHWQQPGVTYFVTFRLADSLPRQKLDTWRAEREAWLKAHPEPWADEDLRTYAERFPERLQQWLDAGEGTCLLGKPEVAVLMENALRHFDGDRYNLDAFVVMPNHVHALVVPRGGHTLDDILHSWKSFTAHEINKRLGRQGTVWQDESFDHIVRSATQLAFYRRYIAENPVKAGLKGCASGQGAGVEIGTAVPAVQEKATGETPVPLLTLSINDLITLNLDIVRFAQDVVENSEPDLLNAFYKELKAITVLDPTCGSGAFLFAALNILYPLYEACLNRMRVFVEDWQRVGDKTHRNYAKWFASEICAVEEDHPNQRYFILKTIILNNLYGVDIMKEATEICRLRLFLKLAAQVEPDSAKPNLGIEPLPDIDFNIRAGNTLVGFATAKEAEDVIRQDLLAYNTVWPEIREKVEDAARHYQMFKEQQTKHGGEVIPDDKRVLSDKLGELEDRLNRYLAADYGVDTRKKKDYEAWLTSHRPFHWFVEFHAIMTAGGFDAIIGNPPYVVYAEGKVGYRLKPEAYKTFECKNLYGYVCERSLGLASKHGEVGLIVQLTALSAEKMDSLQDMLVKRGSLFTPAFPRRPESMFDGVEMPVAILLSVPQGSGLWTSRISRFYTEERPAALHLLALQEHALRVDGHRVAKLGNPTTVSALTKLLSLNTTLETLTTKASDHLLYYQEACRYWVKACKGYPHFRRNGKAMPPPHGRVLPIVSEEGCAFAACLLNSSLFYWFYSTLSDCEHINDSLLRRFRIPADWAEEQWPRLWGRLAASLEENAVRKTIHTKQGHKIEYHEMNAALSKPIIDEIDRVLAKHYGLSDEQLDFVINYDIKYRMSRAEEESDE